MPDITMCMNDMCERKQFCYRYTAKPTPGWQSMAKFNEKGAKNCDSFWSNGIKEGDKACSQTSSKTESTDTDAAKP